MSALDRLLRYVKINTQSDEDSPSTPSDPNVFALAELLEGEMRDLGLEKVRLDRDFGYVYGILPASPGLEDRTRIGFIAHMDTSPDFSGEGVNPQIHEHYDGSDVILGHGRTLRVKDFPHLPSLKDRTLITTDGSTLLGADDKAGIAAILSAVERIVREGIPHGQISVGFTPDEEVGRGADHFDIPGFGAEFAYTVDGGEEGEIVCENFNAAAAQIVIHGFNVHPGSAKDTMINAVLVATELNAMLPSGDTPRNTKDYEGFYHLCALHGDVERAEMAYILRDHSRSRFEARKYTLTHIADLLNEKYGDGTVELTLTDSYYNMKEKIEPCMHVVDNAKAAIRTLGLEPITSPIRGGTDGARLTYEGLPCTNLGTGGYAFHGPYEHITKEGLELASDVLVEIVKKYAE